MNLLQLHFFFPSALLQILKAINVAQNQMTQN
jgi:hypothetical protein